jgi:hypothetical protein
MAWESSIDEEVERRDRETTGRDSAGQYRQQYLEI